MSMRRSTVMVLGFSGTPDAMTIDRAPDGATIPFQATDATKTENLQRG
jgi:hypothetical protein